MDFRGSLAVEFYSEDHVAIITTANEGPEGQLTELLLFCLFAMRQLVNLGVGSPAANAVADALRQIGGNFYGFLARQYGPQLVEVRGPAAKRFYATMIYTAWPLSFQMKASGFGLLARNVDRYAGASVIGLVRHLAMKRRKDCAFLAGLRKAASGCAILYQKGEVSLTSQVTAALALARSAHEEIMAVDAATPLVDDEDRAREAGAEVTVQDLIDTLTSMPKTLEFWSLDQATRMVFHRMVQEQTAIFCDGRPSSPIAGEQELSSDIGKAVYDGYIIGRRLWGTHNEPISFSAAEAESAGQRAANAEGT